MASLPHFTAILLCCAAALSAQDAKINADFEKQMRAVIGAYAIAQQNEADPISSDQAFYQGAIPGLLRKLDPHSVFFSSDQFEQLAFGLVVKTHDRLFVGRVGHQPLPFLLELLSRVRDARST